MTQQHDPWPLERRRARVDQCTMEGHDHPVSMTRRYADVNGVFAELRICQLHDGDAAYPHKINPTFGRKRCPNRTCLRRWAHPGDCP